MSDLPRPDSLADALHQPGEQNADRIVALLGRTAAPVPPPNGSRERLLTRLQRETKIPRINHAPAISESTRRGQPKRWLLVSVACAAGLLVGLIPAWYWKGEATSATLDHEHDVSALQDLRNRINSLQFEAINWQSKIVALEADNVNAKTQATTLRADKASLQAKAVALEADRTALQRQADKLREEMVTLGSDSVVLQKELATLQAQVATLRDEASRNEELLTILRSSQVQTFVLRPAENGRPGFARILWDQQSRRWHLSTEGLPVPAQGRTYELWFITEDQRKVAAGTFDVDASGQGTLLISLPPGLNDISLAAVTDEPRGGVAQPTGSIHLAGKLP